MHYIASGQNEARGEWIIEDFVRLYNETAEPGTKTLLSGEFDTGRWFLAFMPHEEAGWSSVELRTDSNPITCKISLKILSGDKLIWKNEPEEHTFNEGESFASDKIDRQLFQKLESIKIVCVVKYDSLTAPSLCVLDEFGRLFDNADLSDVRFTFPNAANGNLLPDVYAIRNMLNAQSDELAAFITKYESEDAEDAADGGQLVPFTSGSGKRIPAKKRRIENAAMARDDFDDLTFDTFDSIEVLPTQREPFGKRNRIEIPITEFSYSTWIGFIRYFYTRSFPFDSRLSHPLDLPLYHENLANFKAELADPKQVFRLADKFGIQNLKTMAEYQIKKGITVENVGYQVFGTFADKFKEFQRFEIEFVAKNWSQVLETRGWKAAKERIKKGKLPNGMQIVEAITSARSG